MAIKKFFTWHIMLHSLAAASGNGMPENYAMGIVTLSMQKNNNFTNLADNAATFVRYTARDA
jgi:hypothetical protein